MAEIAKSMNDSISLRVQLYTSHIQKYLEIVTEHSFCTSVEASNFKIGRITTTVVTYGLVYVYSTCFILAKNIY